METSQPRDLNAESRRIWDANAEWWDDQIGEGNDFQTVLIEPATETLLGDLTGQTVLDVACGAGRFARRMAALGARVVACDFSARFLARARQRTPAELPIDYHLVDATDRDALLALGVGRFDQAVATMALMDMAEIAPLFDALAQLLRPGGHFTFTICHPCFQAPGATRVAELIEHEGTFTRQSGMKVVHYRTPVAFTGVGIVGQPRLQYYFHRPISEYLRVACAAGFVLDGMLEPAFPAPGNPGGLRWDDMAELPPVLAVRLRLG